MNWDIRHERWEGAGVGLHVARAGEGPPVLLLHGFPEFWRSWRHQIPALADAGFSVLAPDLRGYNQSDKPAGIRSYHLRFLVEDAAALIRATPERRAHVVGHDWGGVIAWVLASEYPELVNRLVILNAPHPRLYLERVWRFPQLSKSRYVFFFQLPRLPERALSANNFAAIRRIFRGGPARPGAFSDEDIEKFVEAISQPGALTAALNYYRALRYPRGLKRMARKTPIEAETLVIWGDQDPALGTDLLVGLDRFAPRMRLHRIPDASHWIQNEAPGEVNRLLVEFLLG